MANKLRIKNNVRGQFQIGMTTPQGTISCVVSNSNAPVTSMAGWPEHCRRHLSFVPLISCSTRSQAFCERTSGENVLSTSEASSAERQRILTCGAAGAPLMLGELVTFQKP